MKKSAEELIEYYKAWLSKYPLVSIEDPFDQDDWDAYKKFMDAVGRDVQVVGDDLLVTNTKRIHCRSCCRDARRRDQNWGALSFGASGQVQPAHSHRGGVRPSRELCWRKLPVALGASK